MIIGHDENLNIKVLGFILILVACYYFYPVIAVFQNVILGKVPFKSVFIKFAIVFFLLWSLMLRFKDIHFKIDKISKIFLFLILSSGISLVFMIRFHYSIIYLFFSYNVQMFWLIMLFILFATVNLEEESFNSILNSIKIFIVIFFFLNFVFALFQHAYNKPIIQVISGDEYYKSYFYFLGGKIKAYGLMFSGLDFGILSNIALFIAIFQIYQKSKYRILWLLFGLASICGIYITYTRVPYLMLIFGLIFFLAIKFKIIIKLLPVIYFIFGLIIAFFSNYILKLLYSFSYVKKITFFNTETLHLRLKYWNTVITKLKDGGILDILFGTGIIQNDRFPEITQKILIDNLYLSSTYYNGVIVLVFFIILYGVIYHMGINKLMNQVNEGEKIHSVLVASFCLMAVLSGVSFFANFIPDIYIYMLVPVLFLSVNGDN